MVRTISITGPTLTISGPPSPPEPDFKGEAQADRVSYDQAAKEFFVTREAFAAAADRPDFPRATARYGQMGGRELIFRRSQIAAWIEKQRALVASFK